MHAPTIIMNNKIHWLTVLAVMLSFGLALSACSPTSASTLDVNETATGLLQPLEPTATATSTSMPTATLIETPSSTPTVTLSPSPFPTPAPTPIFGSARVGNDFLFGNQPEGCELPCWQGLVVGESDAQDVQKMFETAFGFSGISNLPPGRAFDDADEPDLLLLPQQWSFGDSGDTFAVVAWVQKASLVLEAVHFYGQGSRFEPYVNPQRILRELETPSHILVSLGITELADWANLELLIIYNEGITVYYGVRVIRVIGWDGSNPSAELCLGNIPKHPLTDVFLTKPFEGDDIGTLLSPLQYMGIDIDKIYTEAYQPFEEVFGMSLEEVTKLAQEKNNACIYAPAP